MYVAVHTQDKKLKQNINDKNKDVYLNNIFNIPLDI